MECEACESVEALFFPATRLWLWLPSEDAAATALALAAEAGAAPARPHARVVSGEATEAILEGLFARIEAGLPVEDLQRTRALTLPSGEEPTLERMGRILDLPTLIARFRARWIQQAVADGRYTSWFQPIVRVDRGAATPFGNEALFRLTGDDGRPVPPGPVFRLAEKSGLIFDIDLVARRSAVAAAARARLPGRLFVNFNPSSIYDPAICLRSTAAFVRETGLEPSRIVFELVETGLAQDTGHLKEILAFYRDSGFGIALDDVGSGYSSLTLLNEVRPDFLKIDMDLIRGIDGDPYRQGIVGSLIAIARANGILSIGEGVETEAERDWLAARGVDLMQGYLFARPAPVPDSDRQEP